MLWEAPLEVTHSASVRTVPAYWFHILSFGKLETYFMHLPYLIDEQNEPDNKEKENKCLQSRALFANYPLLKTHTHKTKPKCFNIWMTFIKTSGNALHNPGENLKFLLKVLFFTGWQKIVVTVNDHGMGHSSLSYLKNVSGGDIVVGDKVLMLDNNVKGAD